MGTLAFHSDGFDHTTPATAAMKYRTVVGAYTHVAGPYHGNAARFTGSGNSLEGSFRRRDPFMFYKELTFAAHLRLSGDEEDVVAVQLLLHRPASGIVFALRQTVELGADGTISIRFEGPGGTVLGASPGAAFPRDEWFHFEYRTYLVASDADPEGSEFGRGMVAARVDGAEVLRSTGIVTCPGEAVLGQDYGGAFRFGHIGAEGDAPAAVGGVIDYDDVLCSYWVLEDEEEAGAELWQGQKRIATRLPDRRASDDPDDTGLQQFPAPDPPEPEDARTNWMAVDEAAPDLDATYVRKPAGTLVRDRYRVPAFPAYRPTTDLPPPAGDPAAAQVLVYWLVRADDGAANPSTYLWASFLGTGDRPGPEVWVQARFVLPTGGGYGFIQDGYAFALDEAVPDGFLDTLVVGWGVGTFGFAGEGAGAYRGSQVAAELAYLPLEAPAGAGRTWALWWP